ncbi:toxin-antitoxin system YwqK family antitoxin [uncultured Helicobacter sp.]|uniref:toxin-antitoxin system YwqK family antitoxin n=1 Tax=uncultured Helicobacter sp. TaxID=175537 RepID=UPI001C3B47ED|nr:hypothetical protein [Candidatus Helicobacter avicola]
MKTISGFLRYSVQCAILVCVCIGLYSCSPQTSSLDTNTQASSTTSAHSHLDSQATKGSKNSQTQAKPKEQNKDSQKNPKLAQIRDSQGLPQSNSQTQTSNNLSQESNPKGSQGLKFAYKDLVTQSLDGADYNYTGVVRLYHNNGTLAWEISFKDGKQDGWTKWYYDNGQIRTQMFFVDGNANGESLWYYRHGVVREEGRYTNDLADGESKLYTPSGVLKYTIVYRNGREVSRQEYDQKGRTLP